MPSVFQRARPLLSLLSILLLCLSLTPAVSRAQEEPTVIPFTAVGKDKHFFAALRKEDIRILEDGVPQEIIKLEPQTDSPVALILLIDTSLSQDKMLSQAKRSARGILNSIFHPEKDLAGVISFAGEATLEQGLTSDVERLRSRIETVLPEDPGPAPPPVTNGSINMPALSTSIWDAVWIVSSDAFVTARENMRRAIILFSDGMDTSSTKTITEAIEQATKERVTVFAIGAGSYDYGISKDPLRKLAERTGGRAFFPGEGKSLSPILAEIEQALRSQYLITYSSTNKRRDGKTRKIKIEVVNPEVRKQDVRLSYQQGYLK